MILKLLSCDDKDFENLVVDEEDLNNHLETTKPKNQIVVAVSHHPCSVISREQLGNSKPWITPWNLTKIEQLLLQSTGPHLYLHGHLHEDIGYTMTSSTGQNLALLAAGASYQHDDFPMQFAFYDIDLNQREITPWSYKYNATKGTWNLNDINPAPMFTALPSLALKDRTQPSEQEFDELKKGMAKMLTIVSQAYQEAINWIPKITPELETSLTPNERIRFLKCEFNHYGNDPLLQELNNTPYIDDNDVNQFRELIQNNNITQLINGLQKSGKYNGLLLTALVISKDQTHWDQAEQFLPVHGKAFHYSRLGFSAWTIPNVEKAIKFASQALKLIKKEPTSDSLAGFATEALLNNNIAYYYAEKGDKTNSEISRKYANNAVKLQKANNDHPFRLANFTDTLGFVTIVFAENAGDLADGIKACEEARRIGRPL
jgi:hypothetical protein